MAVYAQDPFGRKAINGPVRSVQIHVWKGGRIVYAKDFDPNHYPPQTNNMAEWFRRTFIITNFRPIIHQLRKWGKTWEWECKMLVNDGAGPKKGHGRGYNVFSCEVPTDDGHFKIELHIRHEPHQQAYHRFRRENPDYVPRTQNTPSVIDKKTQNVGQPGDLREGVPWKDDGTIDLTKWTLDPKTGAYYDPRFGPPEF